MSQKARAALAVFIVGFALGLSVFAASRLFVRSVLSADARAAAEEIAIRLADGERIEAAGTLSTVLAYSVLDDEGAVVRTEALAEGGRLRAETSAAEMQQASERARRGEAVILQAPLLPSLFGLAEPAVRGVVAPTALPGGAVGSLHVEIDQTLALQSLTRAFSVIGMVTIGLAVLAVIGVAFGATRGRGLVRRRRFDPSQLVRDALTGLPDRYGFMAMLADAVERAAEADRQVGLVVVDMEGFRTVNDVWGQNAGDAVLKEVAARLGRLCGGRGGLARVSGDEFALIAAEEAAGQLHPLGERICEELSAPYAVGESSIALAPRLGAALFPVNADSADMLFRAANTALSHAKDAPGLRFAVFDTDMAKRMRRRMLLERDLRSALEREEFVVFYQPQLELSSGRLRGYEALVRWERPGEGILAPKDFLPVAEETGLIRPIGEWVLKKACRDAAGWLDAGTVAVNFCAEQFRFQDVDKSIEAALAETGLPAERLEIEVPESVFLNARADVMETLTRIKSLGVRVAMDDFGSGYTALNSLARFPFDKVKIDKSFVDQLTEDADVAAIVASIVALGRSLSVDITAEGVETNEQATLLRAAGCSIVQGFLFGTPQRASENAGTAAIEAKSSAGR